MSDSFVSRNSWALAGGRSSMAAASQSAVVSGSKGACWRTPSMRTTGGRPAFMCRSLAPASARGALPPAGGGEGGGGGEELRPERGGGAGQRATQGGEHGRRGGAF